MIDDPSRAQVSPRRNTPAGRSMSFLYGAGLFGSMIQTDPPAAPGNATAASCFPSADQARNPFEIVGAIGPSSGLASIGCPSGRINRANAPILPPRGSTYAMTFPRDQAGAVAAAGVGS